MDFSGVSKVGNIKGLPQKHEDKETIPWRRFYFTLYKLVTCNFENPQFINNEALLALFSN